MAKLKIPEYNSNSLHGCSFPVRMQILANQLTDNEKRAGRYFMENPAAAYLSITDVVSESKLGYGTIIRFCKKLDCTGFQEFKVLLAQELKDSELSDDVEDGDQITQYAIKMRTELANIQKIIDRSSILKIAKALNKAERVLVAGIAGSASPAVGFDYRLSRIGIHSQVICEGFTMGIRATFLTSNDVLFAISFSGATKDILCAAQVAKKSGATVIALTNFIHSPLCDLADFNLFTVSDRDPISCEIFSNISTDFMLDTVFSALYGMRENSAEAVQKTFNAVSDRRI